MYSASNLGRMHDVDKAWAAWVGEGVDFKCEGIPDGYGHYLPEECPEKVVELIVQHVDKHGGR